VETQNAQVHGEWRILLLRSRFEPSAVATRQAVASVRTVWMSRLSHSNLPAQNRNCGQRSTDVTNSTQFCWHLNSIYLWNAVDWFLLRKVLYFPGFSVSPGICWDMTLKQTMADPAPSSSSLTKWALSQARIKTAASKEHSLPESASQLFVYPETTAVSFASQNFVQHSLTGYGLEDGVRFPAIGIFLFATVSRPTLELTHTGTFAMHAG
jgi:hypothetical protein